MILLYGKDVSILEKCHIPLFIKFPYQEQSIEINSRFSTTKLGSIVNNYMDGNIDIQS